MLSALALCLLSSAPVSAPKASVEHAGYLRDARVQLTPKNHLVFEARMQWPPTITRRSFVVEGVAADGSVLFSRPVTAVAPVPAGRHKRVVEARFDVELPSASGALEVRVRAAR